MILASEFKGHVDIGTFIKNNLEKGDNVDEDDDIEEDVLKFGE